jgi:hypothetical protein
MLERPGAPAPLPRVGSAGGICEMRATTASVVNGGNPHAASS